MPLPFFRMPPSGDHNELSIHWTEICCFAPYKMLSVFSVSPMFGIPPYLPEHSVEPRRQLDHVF